MNIQELWSQGDERHLLDFGRDLATDDLPGALFALGGASDEERQVGRAQIEAWGRRLSAQAPSGDAEAKALALGHVLATELGFKVDERPSPVGVKLKTCSCDARATRRSSRPSIAKWPRQRESRRRSCRCRGGSSCALARNRPPSRIPRPGKCSARRTCRRC